MIFFEHGTRKFVRLLFDSKVFLKFLFQHHEHFVADVCSRFFFHSGKTFAVQGFDDGVKTDVEFFCYLN
jgi:hypothetical protein